MFDTVRELRDGTTTGPTQCAGAPDPADTLDPAPAVPEWMVEQDAAEVAFAEQDPVAYAAWVDAQIAVLRRHAAGLDEYDPSDPDQDAPREPGIAGVRAVLGGQVLETDLPRDGWGHRWSRSATTSLTTSTSCAAPSRHRTRPR